MEAELIRRYILTSRAYVVPTRNLETDGPAAVEAAASTVSDAWRFGRSLVGLIYVHDEGDMRSMLQKLAAISETEVELHIGPIPAEQAEGARRMLAGMARPYGVTVSSAEEVSAESAADGK